MNIADNTLNDINIKGGGITPPCTGIKSDALPEVQKTILAENSHTGVSTKNALSGTVLNISNKKTKNILYRYALRVTYGREKKAHEHLTSKNVTAFYPMLIIMKIVDGKRKTVEKSRIPNLFFAYETEEEIKFTSTTTSICHIFGLTIAKLPLTGLLPRSRRRCLTIKWEVSIPSVMPK